MKALCIILLAIVCLSWSNSLGATWYIKSDGTGDAPTIQAGIDSASNGDTVLLAAGTYTGVGNRNITFLGQTITVTSESGSDVTIIDCESVGRGFSFTRGEGPSSVVSGLTIQNGSAPYGGGIYCDYSSPTITNNTITGNSARVYGGGIYCYPGHNVSPTITNNTITGNSAGYGGGIYCYRGINASPTMITNNTITGNSAGYGGGIFCNMSFPTITNNTIAGNTADNGGGISLEDCSPTITNNTITENSGSVHGGGIYCKDYCSPTVENTIIAFNSQGEGVYCDETSNPTIACCDIFGNAGGDAICGTDMGGNFSADPQFCGIPGSDIYDLQADSPCAPGNHPHGYSCGLIGALPVNCGPVPTMLQTFDAACRGAVVELTWRLSEIGRDSRFFVLRSEAGRPFAELHAARVEIDGLKGAFTDRATEQGRTYRYRVDVSDEDGRQTLFTTQEITAPAAALTLGPAQPNPFNPQTTIHYTVPDAARVRLAIYDARGKLVRTLVDGAMPAGIRSTTWNGRDDRGGSVPSGVYFVRLTSDKQVRTSKIVLLK